MVQYPAGKSLTKRSHQRQIQTFYLTLLHLHDRCCCRLVHGSVRHKLSWNSPPSEIPFDPVLVYLSQVMTALPWCSLSAKQETNLALALKARCVDWTAWISTLCLPSHTGFGGSGAPVHVRRASGFQRAAGDGEFCGESGAGSRSSRSEHPSRARETIELLHLHFV